MKTTNSARLLALCLAGSLAACATAPEDVRRTYVSPAEYAGYSCSQIGFRMDRIEVRTAELSRAQRIERQKDQIATGAGLLLFPPAFLLLIGTDKKPELSKLKGEYKALGEAAVEKGCDLRQAKGGVASAG
jgi:hypothetical protein